jgi:hypothetical protein
MLQESAEVRIYEDFVAEIEAAALGQGAAIPFWADVCNQIREDARRGGRRDFLRWPSLNNFSVPEAWVPGYCYTTLQSNPDWSTKWRRLTRDTAIGNPKPFSRDAGTSPILIQHAYHLLRYEALTGRSLVDCDIIFEVGGGYGSFCRLLKNAGFRGLHLIHDLPHVAAVQRLYLSLSSFEEVSIVEATKRNAHAFCLTPDARLDEVFDALSNGKLRAGLVATWSLSEFPLPARQKILPRFLDVCSCVLIAFQPEFEGINNMQYFEEVRRQRPNRGWRFEAVSPSFLHVRLDEGRGSVGRRRPQRLRDQGLLFGGRRARSLPASRDHRAAGPR